MKTGKIGTKSGFTLIELLVVVGIIALLVAILMPALSMARGAGYNANCLSNLRQIGIGASMYVQDWNMYPISVTGKGTKWADFVANPDLAKTESLGYAVGLLPYHNNKKIYDCPILVNLDCDISYCYNWLAGNDGEAYENGVRNTLTPSRLEIPDRFVFIYDQPLRPTAGMGMYHDIDPSDEWGGADWNKDGWGVIRYYDGIRNSVTQPVNGPHKNGHNILFADGHAKWFLEWEGRNMTRNPQN